MATTRRHTRVSEPWRYVCPKRHVSWTRRSDGTIRCQSCDHTVYEQTFDLVRVDVDDLDASEYVVDD